MRCVHPKTVGFQDDGKTLAWSYKSSSKQYAPFQLPCGKCIECRLEYARECAVRCVHEAHMYPQNAFITLTYDDQHIGDNKLDYGHLQTFLKDLRNLRFSKMLKDYDRSREWFLTLPKHQRKAIYEPYQTPFFATGEYGDLTKRMHWHILTFNFQPDDPTQPHTNELGDVTYSSQQLNELWPHGTRNNFGTVTFKSAGYVARYAAKKLVHGKDQDHEFQPIHKRSSHHAIGKKWLQKYYKTDCFNQGFIVLEGGIKTTIPRYYVKWLKDHDSEYYGRYVTGLRAKAQSIASKKAESLQKETNRINEIRLAQGKMDFQISKNSVRKIIAEDRIKKLNKFQKDNT